MRRSITLLALLAMVTISSCKKGDSTTPVDSKHYTLNGVHDVTLYSNGGTVDLPVEIKSLSNTTGSVTISTADLPSGLSAAVSAATGVPTFNTNIRFTAGNIAPGTYPIKINATSPTLGERIINTNVVVATHCSESLLGYYRCTDAAGNNDYKDTVIRMNGTFEKIQFRNFFGEGYLIEGIVNCTNNTIDIPAQTITEVVGSTTYTMTVLGTGTISGTMIRCTITATIPGIGTNTEDVIMYKL